MRNDKNNFSELFEQSVPSSESEKKEETSVAQSDGNPEVPHVSPKFAVSVISVFAAFLLLPTILWGALKIANLFNPDIMETISFDTGENRAFAKFPTSFNAKTVTNEIEAWYNDNLPFRSVLYGANRSIEGKLEKPYFNIVQPALIKLFHGSDTPSEPIGGGSISLDKEPEQTIPPRDESLPEYDNNEELYADCEHILEAVSVLVAEPTCSEFGVISYPCTKCDFERKEYTKKIDHTYLSNLTELPLCGTNYEETLTCSGCSDTYTQSLQKKHVQAKVVEKVSPSYKDYGYTLLECADCGTQYRSELYDKLYNKTFFPTTQIGGTILGRDNWFFQAVVMPYYQGTNQFPFVELKQYTNTLKKLDTICKEQGKELLIAIWPNKEMVYPEYMPSEYVLKDSTFRRVPKMVDYVKKSTDVNIIYPLKELNAAKPYWELYLPYDTHWNRAGAFIGYQAMLNALGLETTEAINVPVTQVWGGGNDLMRGAGFDIRNYPGQKNYDFNYRPDVKVTLTPTDHDHNSVTSPTYSRSEGATYDKNLVLIGDSYRIMHCGYTERDFANYTTGHKRFVAEDPTLVQAIKDADIIVISSVERLDSEILTAAKDLITVLSEK